MRTKGSRQSTKAGDTVLAVVKTGPARVPNTPKSVSGTTKVQKSLFVVNQKTRSLFRTSAMAFGWNSIIEAKIRDSIIFCFSGSRTIVDGLGGIQFDGSP